MEQEILVPGITIFGASALQSSTGIGFGVIAGPVLLIVLNDGAAIQISVLLNLLIALLLAPSLRRKSDRRLLKSLLIGLAIGSPLGLLIYLQVDIALLKTFAGVVVLFTFVGGSGGPTASRGDRTHLRGVTSLARRAAGAPRPESTLRRDDERPGRRRRERP